jgi:hypothetical protein
MYRQIFLLNMRPPFIHGLPFSHGLEKHSVKKHLKIDM